MDWLRTAPPQEVARALASPRGDALWQEGSPIDRADRLLALERAVPWMDRASKLGVMRRLAQGPFGFREEHLWRALWTTEHGSQLTELKLALELERGPQPSFLAWLFREGLDAPDLRFDLLQHFRQAAPSAAGRPGALRAVLYGDGRLLGNASSESSRVEWEALWRTLSAVPGPPVTVLTEFPQAVSALFPGACLLPTESSGLLGLRPTVQRLEAALALYAELFPEFVWALWACRDAVGEALGQRVASRKDPAWRRVVLFGPERPSPPPHGVQVCQDLAQARALLAAEAGPE